MAFSHVHDVAMNNLGLRNVYHINVKSNQTQALRNIGYYHGFKGYRFIREDTNRVKFTSLDEVIALNKYDMQLKALIAILLKTI